MNEAEKNNLAQLSSIILAGILSHKDSFALNSESMQNRYTITAITYAENILKFINEKDKENSEKEIVF